MLEQTENIQNDGMETRKPNSKQNKTNPKIVFFGSQGFLHWSKIIIVPSTYHHHHRYVPLLLYACRIFLKFFIFFFAFWKQNFHFRQSFSLLSKFSCFFGIILPFQFGNFVDLNRRRNFKQNFNNQIKNEKIQFQKRNAG